MFHSQGEAIVLTDFNRNEIQTKETDELSSKLGDLKGYDYFKNKREVKLDDNFVAHFQMLSVLRKNLNVNLWMKGDANRELFTVEAPYSRAINKESVPEELYHKSLPTLVVRQNGEARTKPFVVVIDAFNQSEGQTVNNINYFTPENESPGFVGIHVTSVSNRHDFIYNDENPKSINKFKTQVFQGRYGIFSIVGKKLKSILLENGTLFDAGYLIIEIPEKRGTVFLKTITNGFEIEAEQPFKLTIPTLADENEEVVLKTLNLEENKTFKGKAFKLDKMKVAEFELPALNRVQLKFE